MGDSIDGDPMDIDSDFYGTDQAVQDLNVQVASLDVESWWRQLTSHQIHAIKKEGSQGLLSPKTETFNTPIRAQPPFPAVKKEESPEAKPQQPVSPTLDVQNPYAGVAYAWQLSESVQSFLERLPPSSTLRIDQTPWIFICNPHWKEPLAQKSNTQANEVQGCENEAPLSMAGTDLSTFIRGGMERLHITADLLKDLRESKLHPSKKRKETKDEQDLCAKDILGLAHMLNVRAGKWMLFPHENEVDEVWRTVATCTSKGELGIAAKVEPKPIPTKPGDRVSEERLICVYTYDFRDRSDVKRVLNKLREIGIVAGKQAWYKTDAYTYLGISGGNPWGLRASLYGSNDFPAEASVGGWDFS